MAANFPDSIFAGQFSTMAIHTAGTITDPIGMTKNQAAFEAGFATGEYTVVGNVREMPTGLGNPSNGS